MAMTADLDLAQAKQMLAAGNFPQAELYLRRYLRAGGQHPEAQHLLAVVAGGYGIPDGFELVENPISPHGSAAAKYLLIKAWGCGFWSDVHHVAGQLLLAELTGRIPVVHWGANSLFGDGAGGNAFELFFEPVSGVTLADLPKTDSIYPAKWRASGLGADNVAKWDGPGSRQAAPFFFDRQETIAVSDFYAPVSSLIPWIGLASRFHGLSEDELYQQLFARLKPLPHIAARAEAFHGAKMAGRHWAAVHVRGSDKIFESKNLHQTNQRYFGFVDRIVALNPEIGVFLLTDSVEVLKVFRERYGDRLVATPALRSQTTTGVHMQGHPGPTVAEEVMVDALLAVRCDYFVGNQESNVSLAIASLKAWPRGFSAMLGVMSGRAENLRLHQPAQAPTAQPPVDVCRLCDAPADLAFEGQVLARHRVRYFRCRGCNALQTEKPYWLDEAYAAGAERFDTGKASRTLTNFLALPPLLDILQVRKDDRAVDFGGGTGLLARLLRDLGYDFHSCDKYGAAEFMAGYRWNDLDHACRVVTMFEVAEHFVDPKAEWAKIFAANPDVVIGSTAPYQGQGAGWDYLSPESGQHIFFYSFDALAMLAHRHGRYAYHVGMYFILTRNALSADAVQQIAAWRDGLMPACQSTFAQWARAPYVQATKDQAQMALFERLRQANVKIALDGVFFRFQSGISRVWRSLLANWSASGFGEFVVVIDRARTAPRHPGIAYIDAPQHQYQDTDADRRMLQEICDRERISLFISTYYTTPVTTPAALMVLDMIPEEMGFDLTHPQWQEKHRAIAYAGSYVCISDSTARDLLRFCPDAEGRDIRTAHCGSDFRAASVERIAAFRAKFGVVRPYFLISGGRADYKNAVLFFKALAELGDARAGYAVLCTNANQPLEPEFAELVGAAQVHMVVLSDDELQCAYSGAVALAYPSRYEGFGLPVLEAMACGCPVITCRISSIPEIGADAVIYVDPDDVGAMRDAIVAVQQPATREALVAKGLERAQVFSWNKMAREVAEALVARALEGGPS
jgi:glycosyltransferase involved in cell wall biosynthesis